MVYIFEGSAVVETGVLADFYLVNHGGVYLLPDQLPVVDCVGKVDSVDFKHLLHCSNRRITNIENHYTQLLHPPQDHIKSK